MELIKRQSAVSDLREAILTSLKLAVEIAQTDSRDGYAVGFKAYDVWIEGLLDDVHFQTILNHNT